MDEIGSALTPEEQKPRFSAVETVDLHYYKTYSASVFPLEKATRILAWVLACMMFLFGMFGASVFLFGYFVRTVELGFGFFYSLVLIALGVWELITLIKGNEIRWKRNLKDRGTTARSYQNRYEFYDSFVRTTDSFSERTDIPYRQICAVKEDETRILLYMKTRGMCLVLPKEFFADCDPADVVAFLNEKVEPGQKIPVRYEPFVFRLVLCAVYFIAFSKLLYEIIGRLTA